MRTARRNRHKESDPEISLAAPARLRGIEAALRAAGTRVYASVSCPDWLQSLLRVS